MDDLNQGFGRLLVAIYGVFAISATARSSYQLATKFEHAPVAYLLSALAAVVYIIATWALATKRTRIAAWAVGFEAVGVVVVGLLSFNSAALGDDTVWSAFGSGYAYIPLVLPAVGLWWLWRHRGTN